jgi:hypothetical protein
MSKESRTRIALGVALAVVFGARVAQAEQPAAERAAAASQTPAAAPERVDSVSGMVVVVDPETKQLRAPVGREAEALLGAIPAMNQSDAGLKQVRLPDGSFMMDLQGRFQEYAFVTVGPDGKLRAACGSSPEDVARAMQTSSSPALEVK